MNNKNIKKLLNNKELIIVLSLLLAFIFVCFYIFNVSNNKTYDIYETYGVNTIDEVTVIKNNETPQTLTIPKAIPVNGSFDYTVDISKYKDTDNLSIMTEFDYCDVSIYTDNKQIYEIKKSNQAILKSNAYQIAFFDIPKTRDHQITIHIEPLLKSVKSYKISSIKIGRKSDIIINTLSEEIITIIVSVILIINFIIMIIIALKRGSIFERDHFSILYLSIAGIFMALYFLTQLKSICYFFGKTKEALCCIEYLSLLLVFAPAILFVKYKLDPKFEKIFNLLATLLVINAFTQFALSIMKIREFKEMITISHAIMFTTIIIAIIAFLFTDCKKHPAKKTLFIPALVVIVVSVFQLAYYMIYKLVVFKNTGLVIITILILLEVREVYQKLIYYKKQRIEKELYKKLATTDSLTSLSNRQAHEDFIKKVEDNKINGWILSMDLNSLKYINDKYGHTVGDKLIIGFSNLLNEAQENNQNISSFRIGGDEFFVFIKENNTYDINTLIFNLKAKYKAISITEDDFEPSFSVGYCYYLAQNQNSVLETYNIADRLMYNDKAEYKKSFRKERGLE